MAADEVANEEVDEGAPELTALTAEAIERGFKFLLRTQRADGAWHNGRDQYAVADTALVLMCFMVQGHFPGKGPHGDALNRAKDFLLKEAKASTDGYLGTSMYAHGLATLALSEMWGMTEEEKDDTDIQKALEAAVKVILRAQNILGGWRYNPQPKDADISVTVTQLVALASARQAGIMVPDETIDKAVQYIESCWHRGSGGFNYQTGRNEPAFPRSAGATYSLQLCGQRDSDQVSAGLRFLKSLDRRVFSRSDFYYYGHYYGIQAMVQAGDEYYSDWYPRIRDALLKKQRSGGEWTGGRGGGAQSTAMSIIVLGTPYRFIPIYQR
jgi:hypothetical protein